MALKIKTDDCNSGARTSYGVHVYQGDVEIKDIIRIEVAPIEYDTILMATITVALEEIDIDVQEQAKELEYLRFFRSKMCEITTWGEDDACYIDSLFVKETGKELPEGY